jgi:hypothetical protein
VVDLFHPGADETDQLTSYRIIRKEVMRTMRVTINLAKGSGPRELVEVLRATEAVKPSRRHNLDLLDLLNTGVQRGLSLALIGLEKAIHRQVCRWVTHQRRARLLQTCRRFHQKLSDWLRITTGRPVVKR